MKKLYTDLFVYFYKIKRFLREHETVNREMFGELRSIFYEKLWRETAKKIGATIEDFGFGYYKINLNSNLTFVLESKVMLDDHLSLKMAGNKPLVHRILSGYKYPVPDYFEYNIYDLSNAYRFMQKVVGACVVKPAAGTGAGEGITTKIQTFKQLRKASLVASTFSPRLLIEKEIPGHSFRFIYLKGVLVDAVRRDPPIVIGDGKHSIKELIKLENERRLCGKEITALSPIEIDYECQLCLSQQGYKLKYMPKQGEIISLKTVPNQNAAAQNVCVMKEVHPAVVDTGAAIAKLLNLRLVGIDLITTDISRPLYETGGVVNEINTNPGLHHHYLVKNKEEVANLAQAIFEYILKP